MADTWTFKGPFEQSKYDSIQQQEGFTGPKELGIYPSRFGIRSAFPRSTPKYARYLTRLNHEFTETTARMYIQVASPNAYKALLEEPGIRGDQDVNAIATVLAGGGAGDKAFGGNGYIDFLLQQANHALNEKYQVVETLSDNYVAFFFGQSAPIFQYSGSLMNTFQDDWAINMLRLYQSLGRGSQLARRGVLFYLRYDSIAVSGSLLNLNWSLTGDVEIVVPFSFNLLVRKIHFLYGGLEPPTYIQMDAQVPDLYTSFWPGGFDTTAEQEKSQGRVDDDMGGASPMGSGTQTKVNQTPPEKPQGGGRGPEESASPATENAAVVEAGLLDIDARDAGTKYSIVEGE